MANIEKAREALEHIRKHPENHNQSTWVYDYGDYVGNFPAAVDNGDHPPCGTTMCMAGWVAFLNAPKGSVMVKSGARFNFRGVGFTGIPEFAAEQLELVGGQQDALFLHAQNLDDLTNMIDCLEDDPDASFKDMCQAAGLDEDDLSARDEDYDNE